MTSAKGASAQPGSATGATTPFATVNVSPFLWKTWNLVSDPSSDHIISWSAQGRTFTVWQPDLLETTQLPRTFKHSNFASFVRQLNNYGFRKCHSDRFEFGVEGFEQGKPELLTNLRRHDAPRTKKKDAEVASAKGKKTIGSKASKTATAATPHVPGSGYDGLELGAYGGITSEVEQLKRDRLLLLKEVMRLREVQSHTQDAVRELSARLASTEQFQSRMMSFVDAVQSGTGLSFDAQGMQKFKEVAATRKRRQMFLPASTSPTADHPAAASADMGAATRTHPTQGSLGSGAYTPGHPGFSLQEMDDDEFADPDDALRSQMFGPLSPNPAAPIQLPEHEWLDMLGGGEPLGGGTEPTAVGRTGPMIRSASRDDDMAGSDPDQSQNAPGPEPDQFVSSILERGPSLDTQMSLGFLERMSSAEIGDMVKDMNINQPLDDEFARRIREIKS